MPNQQRTYQVPKQQLRSQIGNNNSIEQNSKHIKCMSQGQFNAFGSHGELNSFNGIKWIYVLVGLWMHSSEIQDVRSNYLSREALRNLPCFI